MTGHTIHEALVAALTKLNRGEYVEAESCVSALAADLERLTEPPAYSGVEQALAAVLELRAAATDCQDAVREELRAHDHGSRAAGAYALVKSHASNSGGA